MYENPPAFPVPEAERRMAVIVTDTVDEPAIPVAPGLRHEGMGNFVSCHRPPSAFRLIQSSMSESRHPDVLGESRICRGNCPLAISLYRELLESPTVERTSGSRRIFSIISSNGY